MEELTSAKKAKEDLEKVSDGYLRLTLHYMIFRWSHKFVYSP